MTYTYFKYFNFKHIYIHSFTKCFAVRQGWEWVHWLDLCIIFLEQTTLKIAFFWISSLGFFKLEQELKHTRGRNLCRILNYLALFTQLFTIVLPTLITIVVLVLVLDYFSNSAFIESFQKISLSKKLNEILQTNKEKNRTHICSHIQLYECWHIAILVSYFSKKNKHCRQELKPPAHFTLVSLLSHSSHACNYPEISVWCSPMCFYTYYICMPINIWLHFTCFWTYM